MARMPSSLIIDYRSYNPFRSPAWRWQCAIGYAQKERGIDVEEDQTILAAARYLAKALRGYRREARAGRVPFAVDELLSAGVGNEDLAADPPPAHLQDYLNALRGRAAGYFEVVAQTLPRAERGRNRHLLILAALGLTHLHGSAPPRGWRRIQDMLLAWRTARRAHS